MERKVTINDPGLDILLDAVGTLAAHVSNLYEMAYRHRHFTNDPENENGGSWTNMNDFIREADLDDARYALRDLRVELEGLRQS